MPLVDGATDARVLIVDDAVSITAMLATTFRFLGFQVSTAETGRAAVSGAVRNAPDVILLDVMLPDFDGFETCRKIRAAGVSAPVLFLTARDSSQDKVRGFELGGDDYVTKPFDLDELVARIGALLRRGRAVQQQKRRLRVGGIELDQDTHDVRRDGALVALSPTEFTLLRYLMTNAGRVVTKAQLLDHVWNHGFQGESGVVETYVYYLRRKLGDTGQTVIRTVRGTGYLFREPGLEH